MNEYNKTATDSQVQITRKRLPVWRRKKRGTIGVFD